MNQRGIRFITIRRRGSAVIRRLRALPANAWQRAVLDIPKRRHKHIRFVDETRFVHLHNKLILIDGDGVLVSSQNWSNAAVSENREAGLLLEHRSINGYFRKIFESDWSTASKKLKGAPEALAPHAVTPGKFVRVMAGDFREV